MTDRDFRFGNTPFYFLRHGETRESVDGIVQGQNETQLLAKGRESAVNAAEAAQTIALGSIYASPLKRAWDTASIVSILTGVPAFPLRGLMERHWGPFQGVPKELRPSGPSPEAVESLEAFSSRVMTALRSIRGPSPVLVVAHSGVFRVLCSQIGISNDERVTVASGLVLKVEPPTDRMRHWHISVVNAEG